MPSELCNRFDYIIDGGTVEHIFDIAQVMKNVTKMLKVGGRVFHIDAIAGQADHGFYSFSPTFFLDYYKGNGFKVKNLNVRVEIDRRDLWRGGRGDGDLYAYTQDLCQFGNCSVIALNRYIEDIRRSSSTNGQAWIICQAIKEKIVEAVSPSQGYWSTIWKKSDENDSSMRYNKSKILRMFNDHEGKTICIYGKGVFCDIVIDCLYENDRESGLTYIMDGNCRLAGTEHRGFSVLYPTDKRLSETDMIIVGAQKCADEICRELSKRGFKNFFTPKYFMCDEA